VIASLCRNINIFNMRTSLTLTSVNSLNVQLANMLWAFFIKGENFVVNFIKLYLKVYCVVVAIKS